MIEELKSEAGLQDGKLFDDSVAISDLSAVSICLVIALVQRETLLRRLVGGRKNLVGSVGRSVLREESTMAGASGQSMGRKRKVNEKEVVIWTWRGQSSEE